MNLSITLFPLGWQHYLLGGLWIGAGNWNLLWVLAGFALGALAQGLRAK